MEPNCNHHTNSTRFITTCNFLSQPHQWWQISILYVISLSPYVISLSPYVISLSPYVISLSPYAISLSPYVISLSPYVNFLSPPLQFLISDPYTNCMVADFNIACKVPTATTILQTAPELKVRWWEQGSYR